MDSILLATKLEIPPLRARLVARRRLAERLDAGLRAAGPDAARLVLVSAPAGFGKTTLLNAWARGSGRRLGWLSLDEGDNDPARFLAYLLAALRSIDPSLGEGLTETLRSTSLSGPGGPALIQQSLTVLVNRLHALPEPAILVLDDYHLISEERVHGGLAFLLEHLPAQMLLAIATRSDPPLPLARMRARGQLVELRQADLRFLPEEAAEFFQQMTALRLAPEQALALVARTEGWAAGLQLAGLALQGQQAENPAHPPDVSAFLAAFSGSSRYVLDYLIEEVFSNQPEELQTFLLKTSVLDRLSADLCACLLQEEETQTVSVSPVERSRARQALESLERANLFITSLDDRREWYRYHMLFADLLRNRLENSLPEQVAGLHRRASRWFAQNDLLAEAVQHALAARDFSAAAGLVDAAAQAMLRRGEIRTLLGWIDALPPDAVRARPELNLAHLWARFFAGLPQETILAHLNTLPSGSAETAAKVDVLRAFLDVYRGRLGNAERLLAGALQVLSPQDDYFRAMAAWISGVVAQNAGNLATARAALEETARRGQETGNLLFAVMALCQLGMQAARRGQLQQARALYEKAIQLSTDRQGSLLPVSGTALACLADLRREWGEAEEALRLVEQAIRLSEGWRANAALTACGVQARAQFMLGDYAAAEQTLARALRMAEEFDLTEMDDLSVKMEQARLWALRGEYDRVEAWAVERGLLPGAASQAPLRYSEDELAYINEHMHKYEHLVLARLLTARGRAGEVEALLAPHLAQMEAQGRAQMQIEILALQALACQAAGDADSALRQIERAARLAIPGGYRQLLLDEGPAMRSLLERLRRALAARPGPADASLRAYLENLLGEAPPPVPAAPEQPLLEPLSEREREVLRLLESGHSTEAIASRLVVSPHTVRSHLKSIYGKLDAHSRVEALARARELGLLQ